MRLQTSAFLLLGILSFSILAVGSDGQVAKAGEILVVSDPAGDVEWLGPSEAAGPTTQDADIVSLEVGPDDADTLSIAVKFAEADQVVAQVTEATTLWGRYCYLSWTYSSKAEFGYSAYFGTGRSFADPTERVQFSQLNFYHESKHGANWDWTDKGISVTIDDATGAFNIILQKDFIPYFPGARDPAKGDDLILHGAECQSDTGGLWYYDWVEADGARYPMQAEGVGQVVSVSFGGGPMRGGDGASWEFPDGRGVPTTSVAAKGQSLVPVTLQNLASEKKLVMLSAMTHDTTGGWNVSIAPSIFLKPQETRVVNLVATPPPGAAVGDGTDIEVTAEVAAESSVGVATRRLEVAPQLDADNNVIHFHAHKYTGGVFGTVFEQLSPYYDIKLSLLESEPEYTEQYVQNGVQSSWHWGASDPLSATEALLSAEEPATLDLKVAGQEGVEMHFELFFGTDEGDLYFTEGDFTVGTHQVSLVPRFDEDVVLPAGTRFWAQIYMDDPLGVTDVALDLTGTKLTLPVEAVANDITLTDGRFLPNLRLAPGEEKVTYLNPGKQYAFDLNLSNDGLEEDDLEVTATLENATGWSVKVLPGTRYRMGAGESTPVTVSVAAPSGAAEGDIAIVKVTATSRYDPAAKASVTLRSIATSGVELEEKTYQEKEGQLPPLTETAESPVSPWPVLLLLGGVAVALRRRHH